MLINTDSGFSLKKRFGRGLLNSVTIDDGFMLLESRKEQIGEESDTADSGEPHRPITAGVLFLLFNKWHVKKQCSDTLGTIRGG